MTLGLLRESSLRMLIARAGLLLLLSYCGTCAAQQQGASEAGPDRAAPSTRLLLGMKQIADSGLVFDPDLTATALGMGFTFATQDSGDKPESCAEDHADRRTVTTRGTPAEGSWFRALPSGLPNFHIPAYGMNAAATAGAPSISYEKQRTVACTGSTRIRDRTQARISFDGLPAFACLTSGEIASTLSGATYEPATDGVYIQRYRGRLDDESGTFVTFVFRAGAGCALGARIEQDQLSGLRAARANYKRETCAVEADRTFCAAHPGMTWNDVERVRAMRQHADAVCGELDALYHAELATGAIPPDLRRRFRYPTPCD